MYLTLAEIQAFINFVNGNLGKKIFTDEAISNIVPGQKLLTNGVGLGVDIVDDIAYQLGIVGSWDIDTLDTPPVDVKEGQRYIVSTAGTFNGVYAGEGDIVEFLSISEIFVYPLESTLVRLSTLDNYATKTYADNLVVGLLDDRGSYDPTLTNAYPINVDGGSGVEGAVLKGDIWFISADGIVGTKPVYIGYSVRALVDNPGQTESNWDVLNVGLGYIPENVARKKTSTNGALGAPDDIDYPTTKVVSDALALKANITNQTHTGNMRLPSSLKIYDISSTTKEVAFDVASVTAGTTKTITVPDRSLTLGNIPVFQATTKYKQYAVIQNSGIIYSAKLDFTSGASFSATDWDALGSSGTIKQSFSTNITLEIGHEYYNIASPNTPITLELPDPTLVPDGSVIIIHNLAFNSTTTLGRSAWPLPAPSVFLQAPEYQGFTNSTIPAYSKGVITVLSSISATGWLVEKQNSNVIALSSTPGVGKTYFTREDDVSATLGYNLGAIPTATNRVITMPNADVDLGKVAQAASTSVDGYLTATDWNTFNNKNNKNVRIIRVSTQNYTVTTADADGNTSIYMEYTEVDNPTITIPASLTNPITIFNYSYPKNLNITWSGSYPFGGMGTTSPSVIPGFDGIRVYPYRKDGYTQYYQVEWVSRTRYSSNMFLIYDMYDITKNIGFNTSAIGSGQYRSITMPDANVDLGKVAQAASTSTDGYLTATDWNTFNSKEFVDSAFRVSDNLDPTKKIAFQASGIATGQVRTITMPDANVDLGIVPNATSSTLATGAFVYATGMGSVVKTITGSGTTFNVDALASNRAHSVTIRNNSNNVYPFVATATFQFVSAKAAFNTYSGFVDAQGLGLFESTYINSGSTLTITLEPNESIEVRYIGDNGAGGEIFSMQRNLVGLIPIPASVASFKLYPERRYALPHGYSGALTLQLPLVDRVGTSITLEDVVGTSTSTITSLTIVRAGSQTVSGLTSVDIKNFIDNGCTIKLVLHSSSNWVYNVQYSSVIRGNTLGVRNTAGALTSFNVSAATDARVHTYPDKDIDFKTLSSIGLSDGNLITAGSTRCRIVGGQNITIQGNYCTSIGSVGGTILGEYVHSSYCTNLTTTATLRRVSFHNVEANQINSSSMTFAENTEVVGSSAGVLTARCAIKGNSIGGVGSVLTSINYPTYNGKPLLCINGGLSLMLATHKCVLFARRSDGAYSDYLILRFVVNVSIAGGTATITTSTESVVNPTGLGYSFTATKASGTYEMDLKCNIAGTDNYLVFCYVDSTYLTQT